MHGQDSLGRHGIVLSHFDAATGLREQYVVDADGGTLIEERSFMYADVDPACPIGTFTAYALYEDGVAVDPAQVPWIAWPVVIPSCAPGANAA